MNAPTPDDLLLIGTIVAAFGIRGQVKLRSVTDRPDHLQRRVRTVYIGDQQAPYQLTHVHEHKPSLLLLSLRGVETREAAEALRGMEVSIHAQEAAPLAADEYFLHQLYGLRVETVEGESVGTVREVLETGSNEVLIVARPGQSDALIPVIHDVVRELDFAGGRVVIALMEGLL